METIQLTKKAHIGAPCYEAKQKALKSLVYSKGVALTNLQNNSVEGAITTGSSGEQIDLITQLPSRKMLQLNLQIQKFIGYIQYYSLQRKVSIKEKVFAKLHRKDP